MGTYQWQRFYQSFPADGTTPLNQNTLNLYTIPEGQAIRRTRMKAQLVVQMVSTMASGLPLEFSSHVVASAGLWLGDEAGHAAVSPSVLDDANSTEWLFWEPLQERVDTDAIADTGIYMINWETSPAGIDVQTRRDAVAGLDNDLWLGWQIFDPFGVINSSTDTYNAYLTGWYAISFLIYTP